MATWFAIVPMAVSPDNAARVLCSAESWSRFEDSLDWMCSEMQTGGVGVVKSPARQLMTGMLIA